MFTERTRQWLKSLILLCMGLYFLDNMLSGRIYYYINERFGWLSWVATGIFLVLGVVGVFDLMRSRPVAVAEHDHSAHDHEDHDHGHHEHDGHNHGVAPSWRMLTIVAL